jgi:hypothetical protein
MIDGIILGMALYLIFDIIDYTYFDYAMKRIVFKKSEYIIVLDDEDTWGSGGFYIKVTRDEMADLMDGSSPKDVVRDETRWKTL